MSFKLKPLAALVAAGLCGLAVNASAYTPADLGLSAPQDFQIKYNNYEYLNLDTTIGSGFYNNGNNSATGVYLGDNFGIFNVTSIQDVSGTNTLWASGLSGNTIPRLTGVFWGFDLYNNNAVTGSNSSGGHIAVFANSTFTTAIREQGPGNMVGGSTLTIGGVNIPTYTGITGGTLLFTADYMPGANILDPNATLTAGVIGPALIGSAIGYADVNPTVGDLGYFFDSSALATPTPGVFRDLSVQSNFRPATIVPPLPNNSNWPVWSFDPVYGRTVPEPTTLALLGAGFAAFGLGRRNKKA